MSRTGVVVDVGGGVLILKECWFFDFCCDRKLLGGIGDGSNPILVLREPLRQPNHPSIRDAMT